GATGLLLRSGLFTNRNKCWHECAPRLRRDRAERPYFAGELTVLLLLRHGTGKLPPSTVLHYSAGVPSARAHRSGVAGRGPKETQMRTTQAGRAARLAVGAAAAVALLAGCSTSSGADESAARTDVNYALPANATPNWIVPLGIAGKLATHNSAIIRTLWEPLVAYDGSEGEVGRVADADLADEITFSDDGRTVTITLDDRTWSDGEPVTSADVKFWFDVVRASTDVWASYSAGRMPDNVTDVATPDDRTVELTFDQVYNPEWLQASQLTLVVPMPAHAWAKTADDDEPDP